MSNFDKSILIRNINKLIEDNNIKQKPFADAIGMTQPNLSTALNENNKKCFTLEQIVNIADYFHVSVDSLLGNRYSRNSGLSPRAVAEYLVRLVEHNDVIFFKHPVEEEIFEPEYDASSYSMECTPRKDTVEYNAFYFPSYWHIPSGLSYKDQNELVSEMYQIGNDTMHHQTNKFFQRFLQIYALYKQDALEEETYKTVVEDLLKHLRDH